MTVAVLPVAVFTFLFCIFSVYVVPGDKPPEFNFQEGGAVTALSAIYLTLSCAFAYAANLIHFRKTGSHQILWLILAAGFAFLAFDELMQFHERFGRIVIDRIIPRTFFRNWNDAIVILYGFIALPIMVLLLPKILKYRMVIELFAVSFAFYVIHTAIDSIVDPPTLTSNILEESAKLFSTAFMFLGAYAGLLGNTWLYIGEPDSRKD
ncbi:MAG: hypothetical protein OEQ28_10695 [Acidobacteriota bacterium]|nr:hypothetical protein [Acidobacteriota bacterium]